MLSEYSRCFNSVEGNTSFYADPPAQTIARWHDAVPEDFRFTFKFHRRFSHDLKLRHCRDELTAWLTLFEPVLPKTGVLMLQLPASFSPHDLPVLASFLSWLPGELHYAVEVRHKAFFAKGEAELALNRLLKSHNIDRIAMDTRALFAVPATTPALIDAQAKKPCLPVHAVALGQRPVVRFVIASMQEEYKSYYRPWLGKIRQWLKEGRSPYVFFHTADNAEAPLLARAFVKDLGHHHTVLKPFAGEREARQASLF